MTITNAYKDLNEDGSKKEIKSKKIIRGKEFTNEFFELTAVQQRNWLLLYSVNYGHFNWLDNNTI